MSVSKKERKVSTFCIFAPTKIQQPPVAEGIVSSDNVMQGLSIDEWMVLFGHKGTPPEDSFPR
jgi:hypothetical protein